MRDKMRDSSAILFPGRNFEKPFVDLKRLSKTVTATAGLIDYRIHDNRHALASHLVSSGMSPAIVGRLLGHTNPMTTQRHAHLADDSLRDSRGDRKETVGIGRFLRDHKCPIFMSVCEHLIARNLRKLAKLSHCVSQPTLLNVAIITKD